MAHVRPPTHPPAPCTRTPAPAQVRLLTFVAGVMAIRKTLLVLAYSLMLSGLLVRLCLPRAEAAIFDAFNELNMAVFHRSLLLAFSESDRHCHYLCLYMCVVVCVGGETRVQVLQAAGLVVGGGGHAAPPAGVRTHTPTHTLQQKGCK